MVWQLLTYLMTTIREGLREMESQLTSKKLTIVHFNDVYQVEPAQQDPMGGAARFVTAVEKHKHLNPLVVFSGDIFSPSLLSTFARGEHMIPVLNRLEVHVAVFGNHDFDFGLDSCMSLVAETSFPWLLSNVRNLETNRPLAEGRITYITRWNGIKLGFMGLVEYEWLETLATINPDEVQYIDYVEMGNKLATKLREEGCELVIALTHMRTYNDMRLLNDGEGIDLILGGHDHDYEVHRNETCLLVKSGTDFREFSVLDITQQGDDWVKEVKRFAVDSQYEEDPRLQKQLQPYLDMSQSRLNDVIANFDVDLEGRFSKVRLEETNLGNFCADVIMGAMNADCVVLNSGTLRSDRLHPAGDFTMRDLVTIAPFLDGLVLLEVTGEMLYQALENAVSMYPRLEGRFPQVSGLIFVFDPANEPGHRINPRYIKVADQFLQPTQLYRLATKEYLHSGKDGFSCLVNAKVLQDVESSPHLRTAVLNHFDSIYRLKGYRGSAAALSSHRQSIISMSRRNSVLRSTMEQSGVRRPESTLFRSSSINFIVPRDPPLRRRSSVQAATAINFHSIMESLYETDDGPSSTIQLQQAASRRLSRMTVDPDEQVVSPRWQELQQSVLTVEREAAQLSPRVDGRMRLATPEILARLEEERNQDDLHKRSHDDD